MTLSHSRGRSRKALRNTALAAILAAPAMTYALQELTNEEMAEVSGYGIAFGVEDIRIQMGATSYIQQIGRPTGGGTVFQRGDLRWLGASITATGATGGFGFAGEACAAGWTCPVGPQVGFDLASYDNPYLLRVFNYEEINRAGAQEERTVLELIGPSQTDRHRWAFWGDIIVSDSNCADVGENKGTGCFGNVGSLQNQTLIHGKPVSPDQRGLNSQGPLLQVFRTTASGADPDPTFGLLYHSRLSGDFRFSLSRTGTGTGEFAGVPLFNNGTGAGANGSTAPGLKFRNVEAYIPLGQLHYQPIRLDDTIPGDNNDVTPSTGNFVIELMRIPNVPAAYNDFYSFSTDTSSAYAGATAAQNRGYIRTNRPDRYYETHGFVRWGTGTPAENSHDQGIMFTAPPGQNFVASANRIAGTAPNNSGHSNGGASYSLTTNHINLGTSKVDGLLIQRLQIKTLGAQ